MRVPVFLAACLTAGLPLSAIDFSGLSADPVRIATDMSTGLEAVYVLPSTVAVTMSYTAASSTSTVKWYRFSNLGAAYAEEIPCTRTGKTITASVQQGDMGYMIEEGSTRTCFWIVDYSVHQLDLTALTISPEQDCDRTLLDFTGTAGEIPYYNINGRRLVLSRELEIEYSTLTFNEDNYQYTSTTSTEVLDAIGSAVSVPAPLCNTSFRLSGDRFLKYWGEEESIESPMYATNAVAAETRATQDIREVDNEQKDNSSDGLGGSAPCDITFEAAVSDAALFTEWQISSSSDFGINENTFSELSFTYTFRENGTTYIRFVANNADGTCEFIGNTYEVFIGESKLDIPNAFSPNASPGVNDEWKVSYKSLISYECHIFNRWGTQLFQSNDPAAGWDGRYKGKYVPAGVYYYVIKAEGADGIKYEKAGDINIINYKDESGTSSSADE